MDGLSVVTAACSVGSCVVGLMFDRVGFELLLFAKLLTCRKTELTLLFCAQATSDKNCGAVVNRALKNAVCLQNVTLLPFSKYTKKGVSDYILCIARV